jgi:tetratricopeptide (TPR) repeat protein
MKKTLKPQPPPEAETPPAEAEAPAPPPEPRTPERVTAWNAYYDVYVALGVLLLVFLVSATQITNASIWTWLRTGQLIAARGAPVRSDPFSYTMEGRPWVNIPWIFEWLSFQAHELGRRVAPSGPGRDVQAGAAALVAITALVRMLTALVLLNIRRAGPGLWWSATFVALALGAFVVPEGVALGGLAGRAEVEPETWGLLLLAIELALLHRATDLDRRGPLVALIPLFLAWANVDESFLLGLVFLTTWAIGGLWAARGKDSPEPPAARGLKILAACLAVCLINPSFAGVYTSSLSTFRDLLPGRGTTLSQDQISLFGPVSRRFLAKLADTGIRAGYFLQVSYYLLIVGVGLASFAWNRRRFAPRRFLTYVAAAIFWAVLLRLSSVFAVVWAATIALNGQEWYHDRFGVEGRLGRGWAAWSVGGRAVTIVAIFLATALTLTGYASRFGEGVFGFGVDPNDFSFEAADHLKAAPLSGRVLNLTLAEGDALNWRAYPDRRPFIDGRKNLFPRPLLDRLQGLRKALREGNEAGWREVLDAYRVSVLMVKVESDPREFVGLGRDPNWVEFYDDGRIALFGRVDARAPSQDVAYFREHRLEAEALAYRRAEPVRAFDRPPSPVTWIDRIFKTRDLVAPQSHVLAAERWLHPDLFVPAATEPMPPEPSRCLMAIREARNALALRPDDPTAFRVLGLAYGQLMNEEQGLLERPSSPESGAAMPDVLLVRLRQRITALNFAIQTTPPPRSAGAREVLRDLNAELGELYHASGHLDLYRERLRAVIELSRPEEISPSILQRLEQLNTHLSEVETQLEDAALDAQADPTARANLAQGRGAVALAIRELEDAEQAGINAATVKWRLVDLYCDTGQPDRALELMASSDINDPNLDTGPGTAAFRQGRVNFLLGNYENAEFLWELAIRQVREAQTRQALAAASSLLRGQAQAATPAFLELPGQVGAQARWEFELALCLLEAGKPRGRVSAGNPRDGAETPLGADDYFDEALKLAPTLTSRPVAGYYLGKLGREVPPLPADETPRIAPGSSPEVGLPGGPESVLPTLPEDVFAPGPADAPPQKP